MDLPIYNRCKFALADILRYASGRALSEDERVRLRALVDRLASDRFTVVVVGRPACGKSTLINAILGTELLPAGNSRATAVVTTVGYGSSERAILKHDGSFLTKEVTFGELPAFVTQEGNPDNVQRIHTAELKTPSEFLRSGFHFVDTPGFGPALPESVAMMDRLLPQADLLLLVTNTDAPLSPEEIHLAQLATERDKPIFIVINKCDVTPYQCDTARPDMVEQIATKSAHPVHFVSATKALHAQRRQDGGTLAASGLPHLESTIIGRLLADKSERLLSSICQDIAALLGKMPGDDYTRSLLADLAKIDALCRLPISPAYSWPPGELPLSHFHRLGTCQICLAVQERIWRFITGYPHGLSFNATTQRTFTEHGGLCNFHTWELDSISSNYGLCNAYPTLLDRIADRLDAAAAVTHRDQLLGAIKAVQSSDCTLCKERDAAEEAELDSLASRLTRDLPLARSPLLCLPHLQMVCARLGDNELSRRLLAFQAMLLRRVSDDMRRSSMKHDASTHLGLSEEEATAAKRALLILRGHHNVTFDCASRL